MNDSKAETEQSLTEAIHRLARNLHRRPSSHPHGSRGYNRLLRLIGEHNGANSRELAELMDIRPSSLTELLDRLEYDGMIRRNRDENDLRVVRIFLEEAGFQKLEIMKSKAPDEDTFTDILTGEESDSLIELCNKLSDGLEKRSQTTDEPHHKHSDKHGHHHCCDRKDSYDRDYGLKEHGELQPWGERQFYQPDSKSEDE